MKKDSSTQVFRNGHQTKVSGRCAQTRIIHCRSKMIKDTERQHIPHHKWNQRRNRCDCQTQQSFRHYHCLIVTLDESVLSCGNNYLSDRYGTITSTNPSHSTSSPDAHFYRRLAIDEDLAEIVAECSKIGRNTERHGHSIYCYYTYNRTECIYSELIH